MQRWTVERTKDNFEGVRADEIDISPQGTLSFYEDRVKEIVEGISGRPPIKIHRKVLLIAFAPGSWITVFEDSDE